MKNYKINFGMLLLTLILGMVIPAMNNPSRAVTVCVWAVIMIVYTEMVVRKGFGEIR